MSILLRVFLIICALLVLVFMIRRVRKAEIHTRDTVFWFIIAACFIVVAVFPQIAFFFSGILGIESPANTIFLLVIAVLFIREFTSTVEIAKLRGRIIALTQELALMQTHLDSKNTHENRE